MVHIHTNMQVLIHKRKYFLKMKSSIHLLLLFTFVRNQEVVNAYNLSNQELEAGLLQVQGQAKIIVRTQTYKMRYRPAWLQNETLSQKEREGEKEGNMKSRQLPTLPSLVFSIQKHKIRQCNPEMNHSPLHPRNQCISLDMVLYHRIV